MKPIWPIAGVVAALLSFAFAVPAALAEPPSPGIWRRVAALSDEFNAPSLDAKKWHDHNPEWQGREPAFFSGQNVSVAKGKLCLTARAESLPNLPAGYHSFTTASVKSKASVRYAYFEVKWYFDGKLIRTLANTYWHQPYYIVFDSETMPDWFGLPSAENLPSVYRVDYIRCWQREDHAAKPKK